MNYLNFLGLIVAFGTITSSYAHRSIKPELTEDYQPLTIVEDTFAESEIFEITVPASKLNWDSDQASIEVEVGNFVPYSLLVTENGKPGDKGYEDLDKVKENVHTLITAKFPSLRTT